MSSYLLPNVTYLSFQLKRGREIGEGGKEWGERAQGRNREEVGGRKENETYFVAVVVFIKLTAGE